MSGPPPSSRSSTDRIPIVLALGDFASGVTSWAFRLKKVLENHPRYELLLVNCADTKNRIGDFDREISSSEEMRAFISELGRCIVIPNFVFDVYGVCIDLLRTGQDIRCIGFCRADSDDEYYNPLAFYEPIISVFAAVSPRCVERLGKRIPERSNDIFVMPTGVTVPPSLDRTYQNDPIRLVYGGRIAQLQKRVMDLVSLVELLYARGVNFRFDIVGSGRELSRLQEAMAEVDTQGWVRFCGRLKPEEMPDVWQSHDVFIQTSDFEGTSNSMLESMAVGAIPVVTYTESGVDGIINEGTNGFTVPIADMPKMAGVVESLASKSPAELQQIGFAAYDRAREYSIEAYADRFISIIERALDTAPPTWPSDRPERPEFTFRGLKLDDASFDASPELLENATFENWEDSAPAAWSSNHTFSARTRNNDNPEFSICLDPTGNGSNGYLQQEFSVTPGAGVCTLEASLNAHSAESGVLGFNVYIKEGNHERAFSKNHPGDGRWHKLVHRISLTEESQQEPIRFFVVLRKAATKPALLGTASARVLSTTSADDVRIPLPNPVVRPKTKDTKRLLIAFPSPLRGGAEDYTVTIARAAVQAGWDVHTAFPHRRATESLIKDFTELGAQYHRLEVADIFAHDTKGGLARRIARTVRILRRIKPDAVLVELCGVQYGLGLLIGCAIVGVPTKVVFQMVREDALISAEGRMARMLTRWRRQKYIAVSDSNRSIMAKLFRMSSKKILLVPNGADVARFTVAPEDRESIRARVRDAMGISRDCKILITVGRLAPQKGHDIFIPAIPHIVEKHPNTLFIWAGEGPLHARLRDMTVEYGVENYVRFLGRRSDVEQLLAASDLFVHPTRFEGQPFSLLEAIASELPIVTTVASGICEVVQHKKSAYLCEVDDIRAIRDAVLYALDHPDEMKTFAANALKDRLPEYSEELMVVRTLGLFENSRT